MGPRATANHDLRKERYCEVVPLTPHVSAST